MALKRAGSFKSILMKDWCNTPYVCVQDDVRISVEKAAVVVLGPVLHLELVDAPDLKQREVKFGWRSVIKFSQ